MTLAQKRQINSPNSLERVKKLRMQNLSAETCLDFVMMPWDDRREIIISKGSTTSSCTRWELIQRQLNGSVPISNCNDLINVIKSYNVVGETIERQTVPSWKCLNLQKYFTNLDSEEVQKFFVENGILSTIRNLSLQLKDLVPRLQLLKTGTISTIKLHQLQIASILANAFLCTFPKGSADCPSINFNTLYEDTSTSPSNYNVEKIKCIMHYFSRIHSKQPTGHLSFHRLCIPDHKFPRWDKTTVELSSLRVDAKGKIEDQEGFLQMDFANRYVGGGVLGRGCVQEEIRFITCPELIAARLFTESLADNEALFVVGTERYCRYSGYSSTFKFAGDYQDSTPYDENGHRKSFLIVLDALYFYRFSEQFRESKILRELKKAYVGFKPLENSHPIPLATGNWGCGAFGGDPQLKSLLQLMASSQARRNMLYLTFGDFLLKKQIEELYQLLKEHTVNVGMLYRIIRLYNRERGKNQSVFEFIAEALSKIEKRKSYSKLSVSSCLNQRATTSSSAFVFPYQPNDKMSIEEAHKSSRGKSRESNDEDVENFLDMGVDFEALDEAILDVSSVHSVDQACASQIKRISPFPEENSNTSDVIWFENEVNFGKKSRERQQIGKERVHVAVSPSLYSEDEEIRISSDESFSSTACTVGATQSENLEENLTGKGKLSNTKDSETPHEKRLVQKKITECFLKK